MPCPDKDIPTVTTFAMLFPSFAGLDAGVLGYWLDAAKTELCYTSLCQRWERAVYLYMAHFLTVTGAGVVTPPSAPSPAPGSLPAGVFIQSHQDGDVSTTFNTSAAAAIASSNAGGGGGGAADANLPYSGSLYGVMLSGLLKKRGMHVMNTGMAGCLSG